MGDAEFQEKCLGKMSDFRAGGPHRALRQPRPRRRGPAVQPGPCGWSGDGWLRTATSTTSSGATWAARPAGRRAPTSTISSPGPIRLQAVDVVAAGREDAEIIQRDETLRISLTFETTETIRGLNLAVYIVARDGTRVLDDALGDAPRRAPDLSPGGPPRRDGDAAPASARRRVRARRVVRIGVRGVPRPRGPDVPDLAAERRSRGGRRAPAGRASRCSTGTCDPRRHELRAHRLRGDPHPQPGRGPRRRTPCRSALAQRDVDVEVVVVDDGSDEDGRRALEALTDSRVRVVRHATREGQSRARNTGIEAARGEWIAFLDDDDLWSPDKLREQLDAAAVADARVRLHRRGHGRRRPGRRGASPSCRRPARGTAGAPARRRTRSTPAPRR